MTENEKQIWAATYAAAWLKLGAVACENGFRVLSAAELATDAVAELRKLAKRPDAFVPTGDEDVFAAAREMVGQ